MFKIIKPALVAGLAIAAISAPASAQVNGMATSNIGLTVANSQALQTGFQQINTTYQSQITQVEQLNQQRMQLVQQLDTNNDGNLDEAEQAVLNESNPTVQQIGQLESQIGELQRPTQLARLYVVNQVGQNYAAAVDQVMTNRDIKVMLAPEAVDFAVEGLDVTALVVEALNARLPSVSITPPQGWQPNQATVELMQEVQRIYAIFAQQQAAQAQQQGGQAASGEEVRRN